MPARRITVDLRRCVGCHTCELECALAHSGAESFEELALSGERPGYRVNVEHMGTTPVPVNCQHCEEPACAIACPTGAVSRLGPGKPVLVDESKCIGCAMCVQACPFGMMALQPSGTAAMKCDLCVARLAMGKPPACVAGCPTHALKFEDDETANREKRSKAAERMVAAQEQGEAQEIR